MEWNHYQIDCDSIFTFPGSKYYWFDYPSIALNKDEAFVSALTFNRDTSANSSTYISTVLFQMNKINGYDNDSNIQVKNWTNIENGEGANAQVLVPLSDALQLDSYNDTLYLVSNYSQNISKLFWYELTGNINNSAAQLISHTSVSPI